MNHDDHESKSMDSREELKYANERRIEELLSISNRYVRTQRHLEQNSDIVRLDQLKHSIEIQSDREARMENIKNIVAYGKHDDVDEVENLKKHLEYTEHYLQHHSAHMEPDTVRKTNEKQEHRREQLSFLNGLK